MKDKLMEEVRKTFRPEFLNRIDEIIVFHSLTRENLRQIVELMLQRVAKRVEENGLKLEVTEKAKEILVDEGYNPEFGARPLRRAITRLVEDPLSEEMLRGTFKEGDSALVDANEDGKLVFQKKEEIVETKQ